MTDQDPHIAAVAAAASGEPWIPGMAGTKDPMVEEAVRRFYRYCFGAHIGHLHVQNAELRAKLASAIECVQFYATGASDCGASARRLLAQYQWRAISTP